MSDGVRGAGGEGDKIVFHVGQKAYRATPGPGMLPAGVRAMPGTLTAAQAAALIASGQAVEIPQVEQFPWLNAPWAQK